MLSPHPIPAGWFRWRRGHAPRGWSAGWLLAWGVAWILAWGGAAVQAQESPGLAAAASQAPFTSVDLGSEAARASERAWQFELAQSAMHAGFHDLAEQAYLRILKRDDVGADLRRRATLGQADALIGQGRGDETMGVLLSIAPEDRDDSWRLRRGIAHFLIAVATRTRGDAQRREYEEMFEQIRELRPDALGRDAAWWYFLRGTAANRAGEQTQADQFYERAIAAAVSEAERAVFRLARIQASR